MSKDTLFTEIKSRVAKRNSEQGELAAVTRLLAEHGYTKRPEISTTRDKKGAAVRIYLWRGSPAGDLVLIGGPSFVGEVKHLSELAKTKVPAGFYVEAGAGSERDDKRIADTLARATKEGKSAGTASKAPRAPRAHKAAPAPRAPRITGVRSGGRAPYLPGIDTVRAPKAPKIRGPMASSAPYRPGVSRVYGERPPAPAPAGGGDIAARIQAALNAVVAQLTAA